VKDMTQSQTGPRLAYGNVPYYCLFWPMLCLVAMTTAEVLGDNAETNKPAPHRSCHPRLYLTAADRPELLAGRTNGPRAWIWKNLADSADWCCLQPPRSDWIPTSTPDPLFENLYDRFYAAMHDLAILETLSFATFLSEPDADPYFEHARAWLIASARVWGHEAANSPDAGKAYSVLRVTKGMAVAYDLLYERLTPVERNEVRTAIVGIMDAYYTFFQDPVTAGEGYNKHHGSVDAAPFGVIALALLGEVPQARDWLDLAIEKHVAYLLPEALTPSGTNDQSSNFWASTLLYRIQLIDALKRVTGRDLLAEFPQALPGRIALAAVAGRHVNATHEGTICEVNLLSDECNRSVLFGPNYGQLNYWSPVLVYLARSQKRPIFQYLANWDESLGGLQRTRFVTPHRREELLFGAGPYAYLWYDPQVPSALEEHLPLVFEFPEPEVNEAYLRSSFDFGDIVVGMKKGGVILHAGGRAVFVDQLPTADINHPASAVRDMLVTDDGKFAMIRCVGPESLGVQEQAIQLTRPGRLIFERSTDKPVRWWYMDQPTLLERTIRWPDGTELTIEHGNIIERNQLGYVETPVHFGGMKFADPCPRTYATLAVEPVDGRVRLSVNTPEK
jgi:hypothetical protein